ncbi:PREDICTED: uncharacterized protein LOC106748040 [Dinoponera quadriceps]|uniref:Uncharacterized protein LOC106748040 n=1 Tax=Dinoponera quadriceps TaxID=609295 RepID=A0A6P3XUZ4_DINQU|nr:PREDICTED: uncharacterized protein LOC106748040 [Dinoponera quadriceps]
MQFHCEDGLELLSRFREKQSSINLDEVLFPTGVSNDKLIEIIGASSTGKTLLLCQFLAKCILPAQCKGIKINGCNICAIIIDTLGQIQISKIAEFMTSMIHNAYQNISITPPVETVDSIVNRSLNNLTVIRCCSNDQFQIILNMLKNELLDNEKTALLAIDNIFAYYWQERWKKGILSMDSYVKSLVKHIRTHTSQFRIVTVYTRWDRPMSKNEPDTKDYHILEGMGVNYKLQLYRNRESNKFICHLKSMEHAKKIHYTICNSGIKWTL